MDYILDAWDHYLLTPYVYPASWHEQDMLRQFISLYLIVNVGGAMVYLIPSTLSYFFLFDHKLKNHPLFLKNQVCIYMQYMSRYV